MSSIFLRPHPTTEFKEKFVKLNDETLNLSTKKIEISEKEKT